MIIKYVLKQGNVSPCGKYYNNCIKNYYSLWSVDNKEKYNCVKVNLDLTFAQKKVYRKKEIEVI